AGGECGGGRDAPDGVGSSVGGNRAQAGQGARQLGPGDDQDDGQPEYAHDVGAGGPGQAAKAHGRGSSGRAGQSPATFSHETFSQDTFSQDTFSHETFSHETFSHETFSQDTFSHETAPLAVPYAAIT